MNKAHKWIMLFLFLTASFTAAFARSNGELQVYFIDVEGGQATLFVAPAGQSLLIDTGWPDHDSRDADRIAAAAKKAGISKIDYVLLTHYHDDHVGGVPQLVARIPVGTFIDHGPNRETSDAVTEHGYEAYQRVLATGKYQHIVAKPGDQLLIKGIKALVISADGNLIDHPLPGAGEENTYCKASETRPADQTENARSLGVLLSFGKVRILDLGDLTWDKEMQLMCPVNKLGGVNILVVSHHGWYQSSSPALVDAIHPQVAIMDNGATKGGSKATLETFKSDPGLEALWQLHHSGEGGPDNTADAFIANTQGPDAGNDIELTVAQDGTFSVLNSRTGVKQAYTAR
ncbi:MAG TPA: MBL fold metallo-hydrolase [Pseudacidobacterium sp.]|jgi:beta-lactamase superfamily II metal-dependent hydrolase|nr:MBL fold metallo-hydrolase [Pseudacidobacterium sp.]